MKLAGGAGKHFIITNRRIITSLFTFYMRHCLYGKGDAHCQRIACYGQKTNVEITGLRRRVNLNEYLAPNSEDLEKSDGFDQKSEIAVAG